MTQREVCDLLRERLHERKWRSRHLARRVGVAPSTVSRWLSGERTPGKRHIRRLAQLLNIPVEELIPAEDATPSEEPA